MSHLLKKLQTLAFVLVSVSLSAQYSGTISVPNATFSNLGVLVDSLNAYGLNGALTVNVTATQTAPTGGYVLGNTGSALLTTLSATNTLTLNGGGNSITAFTGTRLGSASSGINDAIFSLAGVDFVTIKRFVFNELSTNTTVTTAMENAVGIYNVGTTAGSANGCQFITIDSNEVNLGNVNSVGAVFSVLPYTINGTTAISWTGGTADVHRNITISNNTMNDGFNGVIYRGSTTAQSRALVVRNNTFNNLGASASTASMYGCWFFYLDSAIVHNNTFNFDTAHGSGTSYGIFWSSNCGGVAEAVGNNINLRHNGNSQTIGIAAGSLLGSAFTLRKNYISFGNMPTLTTGALMGVQHTYGGGNVYTITIDSNIIEGTAPQATSGQLTGFSIGGSSTLASATITNNIVRRINRNGLGATSLLNAAIYVTTMLNLTASNNVIDSIMYTNTSGTTAAVVNGIYGITVTNINILNNRISNLFVRGTTTATTSAVRGIYTSASASTIQNITNNDIFNIGIDQSVTTGGGLVNGIHLLPGATTPLNIERNRIYNLSNNCATGTVNGLLFSQGVMNINNNMISNLSSPNSTLSNGLVGFNATAGSSIDFNYNTISIGRTSPISSSASSFGASGIFIGSTASAFNAKNNIVNIKGVSTSAASNIAALRRVSGTAGTKPANFTLSNNIWNVNTSAATESYIYIEGTATTFTNAYHIGGGSLGINDASTFNTACGAYKSWMGDVAAFTEDSLVAGTVQQVLGSLLQVH
jgi:hypothetical protein